ncbi:SH3 domain-containing protein [Streptomyces flavidovirens]|uniref:SH3 domain-containing protein n=1 Tax=Streptomyces flavidovirens TaxID=67298 RepID=UPI0004020E74|nr:SH3 domain-containing protein [Streptomyces flavidovirens]
MPLLPRSPLSRLGLYAATGAVAALTAAGPALAAADPEKPPAAPAAPAESSYAYKGRVIAKSGLLLRDKPTRASRVIGKKHYGAIVHIFCKTRGGNVHGNDRWYLLTDGTWAWGSAHYIANIGAAPRWC